MSRYNFPRFLSLSTISFFICFIFINYSYFINNLFTKKQRFGGFKIKKANFLTVVALLCLTLFFLTQMYSQTGTKPLQIKPLEVSKLHNSLIKEFFGSYVFKHSKKGEIISEQQFYKIISQFLNEKGYMQIFSSEEAIKFAKSPIEGIKSKIKSENLRNLIIKSLEMSKSAISKIDKNEVDKLYKNSRLSAEDVQIIEIYNKMLDECQKFYSSPEWQKIWDKYKQWCYPNDQGDSQTLIKAKWWQIVLSDAAGAAIGAVVGANPGTCVGAATTLSTLVAKYADKPTSEQ